MFYRRIRTYQEKRFNERDIKYVRAKRWPDVLPEAWDDIRNDWFQKMSWKSRTRKSKSWLRGKLKHRWWFHRKLLELESERVDAAICHPDYQKWKMMPFIQKWEMYWEISEKDLRVK